MNVLAVIPARGGSKRVPGKNLREVGGKPLLAWSVLSAKTSKYVSRIVVSTDDDQIANMARVYGAEVHRRDPELATDTASIDDVLLSVLRSCGTIPDLIVTLQPTCPMRSHGLIDAAIQRVIEDSADACFTAYPEPQAFLFVNRAPGSDAPDWRRLGGAWVQQQQMRAMDFCWRFDGSVVVTRTNVLQRTRARMPVDHLCRLAVQPNERFVDIDDEADVHMADGLMRNAGAIA